MRFFKNIIIRLIDFILDKISNLRRLRRNLLTEYDSHKLYKNISSFPILSTEKDSK